MALYGGGNQGGLNGLSLPQLLALRALLAKAGGRGIGLGRQAMAQGPGASRSMLAALAAGGRAATPAPHPAAYNQGRANLGGQIAWGGQRFDNPDQVAAWINARGGHTCGQQFLQNPPGLWPSEGRPISPDVRPVQVRPHVRMVAPRRARPIY